MDKKLFIKTPVWLRVVAVFSAVLILIGIFTYTNNKAENTSLNTQQQKPVILPTPRYQNLQKRFETQSTVRVIVQLNTPDSSKKAIEKVRTKLLDELKQYKVEVLSNDWTIPYIALEVNERALEYLSTSPYVLNVREDQNRNATINDF